MTGRFVYSDVIGKHGGWDKQAHPRMLKFDQYYSETLNAYLTVSPDGAWSIFLPVEVAGIECFSEKPTHGGADRDSLDTCLTSLKP